MGDGGSALLLLVVGCAVPSSEPSPVATVLPLDGGSPNRDPWELLARGDGMFVSWVDGPSAAGKPWGGALRASSALSRQLTELATRAGAARHGAQTFRLVLPAGYGTDNLARAVGGGFRAAVHATGSSKIVGQARLVPVAAGGTGLLALGPLLGLMALTVAAEGAAHAEQDRKLTAILDGVERLNARFVMETDAKLQTAEQTIRQAHAALLDGGSIPESLGLGTAMSNLQVVRNTSTALLKGWERVVERLAPGPVAGATLRSGLGEVGKIGWPGFPNAVRTAYLAIALDSRRIMLTAAEAQFRNPDLALTNFHHAVDAELATRAAELDRLRSVLNRLATVPLSMTRRAGLLPNLITDGANENGRTQATLATLAAALHPSTTGEHNTGEIEAELRPDGKVQLFLPAAQP